MITEAALKTLSQRYIEIIGISVLFKHAIVSGMCANLTKKEMLIMFETVWSVKDDGCYDPSSKWFEVTPPADKETRLL